MINPREFPAKGKILSVDADKVVFQPSGTTYRLHLDRVGNVPRDSQDGLVQCVIRVRARKLWTVPSGGLFVAPIFGPPRIVQGRVRTLDEDELVINAGVMMVVELPSSEAAMDLACGPIEVGSLVNVSALTGASFELLQPLVGASLPA